MTYFNSLLELLGISENHPAAQMILTDFGNPFRDYNDVPMRIRFFADSGISINYSIRRDRFSGFAFHYSSILVRQGLMKPFREEIFDGIFPTATPSIVLSKFKNKPLMMGTVPAPKVCDDGACGIGSTYQQRFEHNVESLPPIHCSFIFEEEDGPLVFASLQIRNWDVASV
ncbi:MAG TPA: hypothetical protein V6C81_20415 [Planktothrix sp.]|jgi:hypothetical protein